MGEARNPRRDAAFALFVALAIVTALYVALQLVVVACWWMLRTVSGRWRTWHGC